MPRPLEFYFYICRCSHKQILLGATVWNLYSDPIEIWQTQGSRSRPNYCQSVHVYIPWIITSFFFFLGRIPSHWGLFSGLDLDPKSGPTTSQTGVHVRSEDQSLPFKVLSLPVDPTHDKHMLWNYQMLFYPKKKKKEAKT